MYLPDGRAIGQGAEQLLGCGAARCWMPGPGAAAHRRCRWYKAEDLPGGNTLYTSRACTTWSGIGPPREHWPAVWRTATACSRPERAAKAAASGWPSKLAVSPSPAAGPGAAREGLLTSGLAVLTGGPGTGKTTLVQGAASPGCPAHGSFRVPGRAHRPGGQAPGREPPACPPSTLHRLLEYSPKENRFLRNAGSVLSRARPWWWLTSASMVDIWLMALSGRGHAGVRAAASSWWATPTSCPPVGPGTVVPGPAHPKRRRPHVASLTQIFRQDRGRADREKRPPHLAGPACRSLAPAPRAGGGLFIHRGRA